MINSHASQIICEREISLVGKREKVIDEYEHSITILVICVIFLSTSLNFVISMSI